jgi:hypothetical protein
VRENKDFEKRKPVRKPECCGCGKDNVPIGVNKKDWCAGCWPASMNGHEVAKK